MAFHLTEEIRMLKRTIVLLGALWIAQLTAAQAAERAIEPHVFYPSSQTADTSAPERDEKGFMVTHCVQPLTIWSQELRNACQALLLSAVRTDQGLAERHLEDATFSSVHLKRTLVNQAWQSVFLFWVVITITAIGVVTAVTQFYYSLRTTDPGSAELAVSANEFRIKTTWLGALLLGMSMGFLTLYLVFVYPVQTLAAS